MSEEQYERALAALHFFCYEGSQQVNSLQNVDLVSVPIFFPDADAKNGGCNYFFGIACVFKAYRSALYENKKFVSVINVEEEAEYVADFNHRLSVFMIDGKAADWSKEAVLEGEIWARLRRDANRA